MEFGYSILAWRSFEVRRWGLEKQEVEMAGAAQFLSNLPSRGCFVQPATSTSVGLYFLSCLGLFRCGTASQVQLLVFSLQSICCDVFYSLL